MNHSLNTLKLYSCTNFISPFPFYHLLYTYIILSHILYNLFCFHLSLPQWYMHSASTGFILFCFSGWLYLGPLLGHRTSFSELEKVSKSLRPYTRTLLSKALGISAVSCLLGHDSPVWVHNTYNSANIQL